MNGSLSRRAALAGAAPALAALTMSASAAIKSVDVEALDPVLGLYVRLVKVKEQWNTALDAQEAVEKITHAARDSGVGDVGMPDIWAATEAARATADALADEFSDLKQELLRTPPTGSAGAFAILNVVIDHLVMWNNGDDDVITGARGAVAVLARATGTPAVDFVG